MKDNMGKQNKEGSQCDSCASRLWIEQVFSHYSLSTQSIESRHLGFASVKFESYFYPNITFYEIIKQEESSSTRDVIFCMNQTQQLSDQGRYYQFPHEAIVEALNHTSTFDVKSSQLIHNTSTDDVLIRCLFRFIYQKIPIYPFFILLVLARMLPN